ncbi:AraC-like DNA-binding protein [Aquamicrobium lusatiense]|uniref:AraC-like DNA-binding protein n=1 Tax=Aquamicrobium lusatiense TaxID=89772 RepID=A0A7W9S0A8_9HYPH|nr:AraC family transcriptional regulator [Aquamicrobium lusatiense]MBB6011752.1 AraC-like DNA-binding protein [Aquamicrobium lusatiense]
MATALRQFSFEELTRSALRFSTSIRPSNHTPGAEDDDLVFEGRMLDIEVCTGLYATGYDLTYLQDRRVDFDIGASLTCGVLLAGTSLPMEVPGHEAVAQVLHAPVLIGFGSLGECSTNWRSGQRCTMGGFSLRPNFFERFGESVSDDGLVALQGFFRSDFNAIRLPTAPGMSRIAMACINNPYAGDMEALFLESSTLAMVIEIAGMAAQVRRQGRIPYHHRRLLEIACERIDADLTSPPTTMELVREVGTNVTTLQRIFRQALGTTILGYVQKRRLEIARILLQERAGSISDVGYRVGYASPSAFSAAYRKHFGHSPSAEQ